MQDRVPEVEDYPRMGSCWQLYNENDYAFFSFVGLDQETIGDRWGNDNFCPEHRSAAFLNSVNLFPGQTMRGTGKVVKLRDRNICPPRELSRCGGTSRTWIGEDKGKDDPLSDPSHAFNTTFKRQAEVVMMQAAGGIGSNRIGV